MMFVGEHALLGRAGSLGILATEFFARVARGLGGAAFALLERGEQAFAGQFPVHRLGTRILHRHGNFGGQMPQRDARGDFVDVLAARTGRANER